MNTNIELRPVIGSSMIAEDGYDDTSQVLAIKFQNGQLYEYPGVDPRTAEEYNTAASKGAYFSRVIKKNITGKLVTQVNEN